MNMEELLCVTDKSDKAWKKVEASTETMVNSIKSYGYNLKEYIRLEREHISTIEDAIAKGDVPERDTDTAMRFVNVTKNDLDALEKHLNDFSTIMGVILS